MPEGEKISHYSKVRLLCHLCETRNLDVLTVPTSRPSKTDDTSYLFGEFKKPYVTKRSDISSMDLLSELYCDKDYFFLPTTFVFMSGTCFISPLPVQLQVERLFFLFLSLFLSLFDGPSGSPWGLGRRRRKERGLIRPPPPKLTPPHPLTTRQESQETESLRGEMKFFLNKHLSLVSSWDICTLFQSLIINQPVFFLWRLRGKGQ